jgi:hypothetical protein
MTALRSIPSRPFARADDRRDVPVCRTTTTSSALLPSRRAPGSTGRELHTWRCMPSARTVSPLGPVVRRVDLSTPRRLRDARIRPVFVTFTHQPWQVSRSRTRGRLSTAHVDLTHLPSVDDVDLRRRVGVLRLCFRIGAAPRLLSGLRRRAGHGLLSRSRCSVHEPSRIQPIRNVRSASGKASWTNRFSWATRATSEPKLAFSRRRGDTSRPAGPFDRATFLDATIRAADSDSRSRWASLVEDERHRTPLCPRAG